ncbi:hypothetical protein [Taklimakanibacter deserti]|uniref:hypothetical protein n=1 Tax=Taklimakanibacter deserti TaxID=2267839 RepID=UPI000E65B933
MTSTPCQSAALDRSIAPWAKIAACFAIIVETIVTIAGSIRNSLHELDGCCRKTGRLLALCPGLSRPMMPKLGFLPPSVSVLHALARKRSPEFDAQDQSQDVTIPKKGSWITKSLRQRIERVRKGIGSEGHALT